MKYINNFESLFNTNEIILMEGALAERLKRIYDVEINKDVALASIIYNKKNSEILKKLYCEYIDISIKYNLPIVITTPTRRANKERVLNSKYDVNIIKDNVQFLKEIRKEYNTNNIFIGGLMGCLGDAYKADEGLDIEEAFNIHSWQAKLFKEADVDFLFAGIMPTLLEAMGMARAMEKTELPYIISFMIRENGRLLDGNTINDAIEEIDNSVSRKPLCYMTNCVHPEILNKALLKEFNKTERVKDRFKGIQANAAYLTPEELDNSSELKTSNAIQLVEAMKTLKDTYGLKIFGGCCGTDDNYIEEIAKNLC